MTPAARIETAIDLLARIEKSRIPMDATINEFMGARRFIGSKDRTAIVERVYRAARAKARLGWWIAQSGYEDTSRLRIIADLIFEDGTDAKRVADLFSGAKYAPAPLSEQEHAFAASLENQSLSASAMPADVRGECPDWAYPPLKAFFGDRTDDILAALLPPAALDLRVNTMKGTVDDAIASLAANGVTAVRTKFSPVGLRVEGKPFMGDTKAFRSGLVEIQDEGSQLIALLCGAHPGARILDYCAGGGGKTLAIAAAMENKGNVVAMDNETRRLEKGRPRYKKAGAHNVELRSLEEEQHRKWLRRQKGTMDAVLVDAPCSSSGTWRRNPDLRWRFYGPSLDEIIAVQAEILDRVADKTKPGGRLVYATCSLLPAENEDQVAAFLARRPDYEILPLSKAWKGLKTPCPCDGDFLRMNPADHGTDGFFAAVLIRK